MTGFEFAVTYAVCWWLVLFMVLPHQAAAPQNPELGHARSAPENPQLGRKMRWATLLAVLPAVALYFIVGAAKAEDTIYHVGSGCQPLPTYQSSADVEAKDGYSTGGKTVKPATLEGNNMLGDKDKFDIPVLIPSKNYVDQSKYNVDMSQSFVHAGDLSVSKDGTTTLNGKPMSGQATYPDGCAHPDDKKPATPKK
jgi:predicted secreted protein